MKKLTEQARLFTLIGITASIIGYLFLMYTGFNLTREITERKTEIEQLEQIRIEKVNHLAEIESRLLQITSSSRDPVTVKQGEALAREFGIPTGQHFTKTSAEETNVENARRFEEMGFRHLLERNIDEAIDAFVKSENSYNSYHQVYEIARFLLRNKSRLSDPNADFWDEAYQTILTRYSWKMPENYKKELQKRLE